MNDNTEIKFKIYIKYMVSHRCKLMVIDILDKMEIKFKSVELGMVHLYEELTKEQYKLLDINLRELKLEILETKKSILIEKIKNTVIEMIHHTKEIPNVNFSIYIAEKLDHDYTYLANMFMEVTGITIQHFVDIHKIEKVKELLIYDELTLTEIAFLLNFNSVQYLSGMFKKITGITSSKFKELNKNRFTNLENL